MGDICALSVGNKHHFFGYYGVNAWDPTFQYHLSLETDFDDHRPTGDDVANVGLVDRKTGLFESFAQTSAFNLQQGSMMHWIDAGGGAEFTFNDWEDGALISRALNPQTKRVRKLGRAVAAVSPTEPVGIGLNFARMAHCRAVVGYANDWGLNPWVDQPDDDGLFAIDLQTGDARLLVSIAQVITANPCAETETGAAWFNHVYYNTDGSRLLFLCRVKTPDKWHTSVWSVNADGSDLEMQIPYGYHTSHFAWRDQKRVMISSDYLGDMRFLEFEDRVKNFEPFGGDMLPPDGHNAFSPNGQWVACDTYPKNEARLAELMLYHIESGEKISLGKFHHAEKYTGDVRCDLHPRWSPDGKVITFDSVHGDNRQIYLVDVEEVITDFEGRL